MAQLGARLNGIEEVEGSNPSGSTNQIQPVLLLVEWVVFDYRILYDLIHTVSYCG